MRSGADSSAMTRRGPRAPSSHAHRGRPSARAAVAISACLAVALVAEVVLAQSPTPQVYRLELKEMKGIEHGKAAVVKGEAGPEPHRFLVEGLTMNMPVVVLLRPVRPDDSVGIRLTKYAWDQPLREGVAEGEPLALKFRTEGEFQISVSTQKAGTPYRMMVWTGDEVEPDLRPVVVKASEYGLEEEGSGMPPVLWMIAGLLAIGVALLAVLLFRRSGS